MGYEFFVYLFVLDLTSPADQNDQPFQHGGLNQDSPAQPVGPAGRAVAPLQAAPPPPPLPPPRPPNPPPPPPPVVPLPVAVPNLCKVPHPPLVIPPLALQLLLIPLFQEVVRVPNRWRIDIVD